MEALGLDFGSHLGSKIKPQNKLKITNVKSRKLHFRVGESSIFEVRGSLKSMKNQCQNDFKIGPHLNSGKKLEKAPNIDPTWGPKTIPRGSKKTFEIALKNNFKSLTKLKQQKSSRCG